MTRPANTDSDLRKRLGPFLVPTAASLALHTALLLLVLTVTLTVTTRTQLGSGNVGPAISLSDPVVEPIEFDQTRVPWSGPSTPFEPPPPSVRRPRSELNRISRPVDTVSLRPASRADERRPLDELRSGEHSIGRSATFAGMKATRVGSVVYVVDTSGAMINSLSFVLVELRRSIEKLSVRQSFQVVLFGRRSDDQLYESLPDRTGLVLASPKERGRADMWLDSVFAGGRSNPLDGLRKAIGFKPDVVFLLSRSIKRTGAGVQWGRGKEAILAELDRLNPLDEKTGRRPVVIKTIQFLDEDPSGIMQAIGEIHGDPGAPQSGEVLTLSDLVRRSHEPEHESIETPELDEAAKILAELAGDGSDTAVLFGVPRDDQRLSVAKAASRAAALLERAERRGVADQDRDLRLPFLRAKSNILLAAISDDPARRAARADSAVRLLEPMKLDVAILESARLVALGSALMLRDADSDKARAYAIFRALTESQSQHTDVDPLTSAEAWFGLIFTAPDSDAAFDAALKLRIGMESAPFIVDGTIDSALIVAGTDAISRGLIEHGDDNLLDAAFAVQVTLLYDDRLGLDLRTRRSLVFHRISVLSRADMPFDRLPAIVAFGRAAVLANDYERLDEAVRLFDLAAERAESNELRFEALWEGAVLLIESPEPDSNIEASARLRQMAEIDPTSPRSLDAILAALDLARAYDDAQLVRAPYLETLIFALDTFPAMPARNAWQLECARLHLIDGDVALSLDRLGAISHNTPEGVSARRIFVEVAAGTLDRLAEEIESLRVESWDSLAESDELREYLEISRRAADFSAQLRLPETDRFLADLAEAMLESGSSGGLPIFADLFASGAVVPCGQIRLRLGLARSLRLVGDDRRAFEELRELTELLEGVEPRPREFWHAWTITLEMLAEHAKSDDKSGRIGAHIARLRSLDDSLGGQPWSARLERVERSVR